MDELDLDETFESDEETVTAAGVLNTLQEAWLNEKLSPEILPHKAELVQCMMEQIEQMEENIKKLDKNDFKVNLHRLELDRIRYLITSYLRTRIEKIECFPFTILESENSSDPEERVLSPSEYTYTVEYVTNMSTHFQSILNGMPQSMRNINVHQIMIKPNLESHVFLKSISRVPSVLIRYESDNREDEISLDEDSQHILPYKPIADFLKNGMVKLI
uniref:DNA replication complex GINS protein SLD5 n=1 Tax=Clastoptera arizonana TaxID=38151 RepID=A0A1B6E5G4_9HEMI